MGRNHSTNVGGHDFSDEEKLKVWKKAAIVDGYDPTLTRKDTYGALIEWNKYGVTKENGKGWEIDHIKPIAKGGTDYLSNLQPLQWENNRTKSDDYPVFSTSINSFGNANIKEYIRHYPSSDIMFE
jgi:hypothetical protein